MTGARIDADGYCRECRTKHGPWGHATFPAPGTARCIECGRVFDLADPTDSAAWHYGHDCEVDA